MLEGLEISEQNLSEIDLGDRADAEYYRKENLRIARVIEHLPHRSIAELSKLTASAFYPAATQLYEIGDMPLLRCVDAVTYPLISQQQDELFVRVPTEFAEDQKGIHFLTKGDICLTKVGTPCFASVIHEHKRIAMSRTVMGLSQITGVDPYYLMVFLRCHHGFSQLFREREQTIQFQLTLDRVGSVNVFLPDNGFQSRIRAAALRAFDDQLIANCLREKAGTRLLKTIGLFDWRPPNPLTYEKSVSEVFETERLDSQFFQVRYQALEERLAAQFELQSLESLCTVTKGRTVPYTEDGDVKIIRSGDLVDISDADNFLTASSSEEIFNLERGDVLISSIGFGSIGKVQVFDLDIPCGTVSEVTVLRPKSINPYFLCAFLRSIAGQLQIERWITGATGQLHLYARDVKKILVPLVREKKQMEFEKLHRESQSKRQHSKALLERAKRAVEIAIEQDEETALAYLDGKHYVADELLPKLFGLARHYVDLDTIQRTLEAEAIHYEDSTIHRYLHEWQREGRLHDAGRGWYSDLPESFTPDPGIEIIRSVQSVLKDEFPLLDHTIWSTRELSGFFHHLPTRHATYLLIDRDAFDPVADALRDAGLHVAVHPLGEIAKKFSLEHDDTVILRPRLSSDHTKVRSPIEHTLVDLHHEIQKLGLFEGEEYRHIVRNLATTKRINITALKRYAERRKIDPGEILDVLL